MARTPRSVKKEVTTEEAKKAFSKSYKDYQMTSSLEGNFHKVDFSFPGFEGTGHHLMIRSRYSKEYREAEARAARQIRALAVAKGPNEELDPELLKSIQDTAFAALVESWTFEEDCNSVNVVDFFNENPHMYELVNVEAATDSNFFK